MSKTPKTSEPGSANDSAHNRPHPDFDGHPERPFAAWSATEKWRWAAGLERLRQRVTIEPNDKPAASDPDARQPDSTDCDSKPDRPERSHE